MSHTPQEQIKRLQSEKDRLEMDLSREVIKPADASSDIIKYVTENSKKDMLVFPGSNPYNSSGRRGTCSIS